MVKIGIGIYLILISGIGVAIGGVLGMRGGAPKA
jgi:hypothetical protein